MPPLTDHQLDELVRAALDERVEALLPLTGGEQAMVERLAGVVARRQARRQATLLLLAAALLLSVAIAAAAVGSGLLKLPVFANASLAASPSGHAPTTPTAVADRLIAAWNTGDSQDVASLYTADPMVPFVLYIIDSGAVTQEMTVPAQISAGMTAWHAQGSMLARTGDVLTEGPFAAFPVIWTSSGRTFDGVEVIRISTGGFVSDDIRIGASATGSPPPVDPATLLTNLLDAQNSSDASAASKLLAPTVEARIFRNHAANTQAADRTGVLGGIDGGTACCMTNTSGLLTQGPFIAHTYVLTNASVLPGAEDEGVEVLKLNGDGQIAYIWHIDMRTNLSATPAPAAGSSSARLTVSAWRQVDPNPLAGITETYPPVWSGTRFIIAGHPLANPPRRTNDVQFLTSSDGRTWSASPWSKGYPLAYAFDGVAGVAVGSDGNQAAVWTSPDGKAWTKLPNPPALTPSGKEVGLQLTDVAHGPTGYVALAELSIRQSTGQTGKALVLWSSDGRAWQRVPMGPFQDTEYTELRDVVAVHARYVIVGTLYVPESSSTPSTATPTLWTSVDGRTWEQEPAIENGPSALLDLAAGSGEALLTGSQTLGPGTSDSCVAWRSSDGLVWAPIVGGCPPLLGYPGLISAPFGFVASTPYPITVGTASPAASPPCAGGIEVSATGEQWTCVPPPSAGPVAPGDLVAASANEIVWVAGGVWVANVQIGH